MRKGNPINFLQRARTTGSGRTTDLLRGFTIVELLVSVSIILVLVGITSTVVGRARASGQRAVATSNLRQALTAILLYQGDWGSYPELDVARQLLPAEATWDPADHWRKDCREVWPPLLGSFGYRGYKPGMMEATMGWRERQGETRVLIASIFHERPLIAPFRGEAPGIHAPPPPVGMTRKMPEHVLAGNSDLSVKRMRVPQRRDFQEILTWGALFTNLNNLGGRR